MKHYDLTEAYSFTRHVQDTLDKGKPILDFEAEPDQRIKRQWGIRAASTMDSRLKAMYVPWAAFGQVQQRGDLGGTTFQTLTGITQAYTTGLVAHSQIFRAGAIIIEGCEGQIMLAGTTAIPLPTFSTNTDGTTTMFESEPIFVGGSVGANSMIFSPLRLGVKIKVSNQLLVQAAPIFAPVLRDQISRGISSMLDNLTLFGTGTSGQPLGIFSTVTPVNLAGTPIVWSSATASLSFVGYRQAILQTDLDPDSWAVIASPSMEQYLNKTLSTGNTSFTIFDKMKQLGPVLVGNESNTSSPMASGQGLFAGLFRFVYLMLWADGVEVTYDRYSSADTVETVIRASVLANVGITFPSAFSAIYQTAV